jgi:hypothetical protein
MHKNIVHWGLNDMIESVNHEGGHTTSRPGEHPSSKDVTWHNIWEGTRHNDISVKKRPKHNARPLYPGQV